MVRIVDYKARRSSEGELFLALIVQGGISLVKSKETGLYYATAKKASIPSTFDEETCKSLVGQEMEGTVENAILNYIIRDHDRNKFEEKKK